MMGSLLVIACLLAIIYILPLLFSPEREVKEPQTPKQFVEVTPKTFIRNNNTEKRKKAKLSKGEALCRKVVDEIVKEKRIPANVSHNIRPDTFKNPRTGRNLEIDIFVEIIGDNPRKIAIEFNGRQHDEYVAKYHKTRAEFINQQFRDKHKAEICKKENITLVIVSWRDIDHMKDDREREEFIRRTLLEVL